MTEKQVILKAINKFPFFKLRDGYYYSTFDELPGKMEASILSSNMTEFSNMTSINIMPHANKFDVYFTSLNPAGWVNEIRFDFKITIMYKDKNEEITCGFRCMDGNLDNEFYFKLMDNGIKLLFLDDVDNTLKDELMRMWTIRNIIK